MPAIFRLILNTVSYRISECHEEVYGKEAPVVEVMIGLWGSLHGLMPRPRDGRAATTADDGDAIQPGSSPPSSNVKQHYPK